MSESALVLTEEEWADLAAVCAFFRAEVRDALRDMAPYGNLQRRVILCERVMEAAE